MAAAGENHLLPPEILEEILCNLPAKTLLRFLRVSKSWRSIISDQRFARKHLKRADDNNNLSHKKLILSDPQFGMYDPKLQCFPLSSLIINSGSGGRGGYLRLPFKGYNWHLLASYDGLLCIYIDGSSIYICNPCLKKSYGKIKIKPTVDYHCNHRFFELGYDSRVDEYKLFILSKTDQVNTYGTQIYSLRSESWTKLDDFPQDYRPVKSVFVNGSFYWLANEGTDLISVSFALFSFDLLVNKYRDIALPEDRDWQIDLSPFYVRMCVLNGMVCVFFDWAAHLVLWAMKDNSWTKVLYIPLARVFVTYPGACARDINPFYLYENGEVGLVTECGKEVLICKDDVVLFREVICDRSRIQYGIVHVESLISPQL